MATTAAGRRSRGALTVPLRWLAATVRTTTFVIAGLPVQLAMLAAVALPWSFFHFLGFGAWQAAVALAESACVALVLRAPLTGAQRRRCWSLLGIEIPRAPVAPDRPLAGRLAASFRAETTWRQLGYHLVAGPALALGGLLTLAAWATGAGLVAAFGYSYLFPPLSQAGSVGPKSKVILTIVGALILLVAPALAAAVTWLDAKVARALLGPSRSVELERRVETLAESRAGVVDAADAERRRIERDLHDGAQQRLVSLAMNLGMARENLTDLPEHARQVIAEAHDEAKEALTELRSLVRGLHPAVLDDRGLDAALSGIAARAPLPVRLAVEMPERASPTVEAVAYFVASECLANIARHAAATQADIDVRLTGRTLRIAITDDGVGGADPALGTGLASLARRASSVDGTMRIDSPPGGPTVVTVELPCGS